MKRVRYWRRRWCLWRDHPMADWSPIVMIEKAPDRAIFGDDFTVITFVYGDEITTRGWRCAKHDEKKHG